MLPDIEMVFQRTRLSLIALAPPKCFVQDAGKDGNRGGEPGVPNGGSHVVFGQCCEWWGEWERARGSRSAVQRLAFCIVGQLGIKALYAAE